jgi:monooxygenase
MQPHHLDVLIVGAGLSGIGAAYHLQDSFPHKTYAILEARERLGGTWDLFRYPGIRSDSDMYTLGYSFRPWTESNSLADGPAILAYVRETAEAYGIDRKIRYGKRVETARWSSKCARWTVAVRDVATGEVTELTCGFLFTCAGYYDYEEGYTPDLPGRARFQGRVVHPQKWTPDIDYEGKRVVVIGSGATAVTLVPELAKRAAHVTMLQRSPTYILSVPQKDKVADWMRGRLPRGVAYATTRWKNVLLGMGFYQFCRRFPERAKGLLVGGVDKALGGKVDASNITPSYMPWDQRVCFVPDGDLFDAVAEGRAEIVTGHIETFTETGLLLRSGQELPADLVVTATGLTLKLMGGITLTVDGTKVDPATTTTYKGLMLSGVPNLAIAIGYTNASWTLKCDLISQYVCRLLRHMDAHGYTMCCPRLHDASGGDRPLLDLDSGYVKRALGTLPKQGAEAPWKAYQNYVLDLAVLRHAPLVDRAMEFSAPDA